MARPERKNADYFPFYAKDGRTLFILEGKYRCKGTGFFTNVMRFLTLQDDHYFCISDETDQMYFLSKCHCDEDIGIDMLEIMVKTGKLDKELWEKYKIIACQDLLESLVDAYRKRTNNIITIDEIRVNAGVMDVSGGRNPQNGDDNPQRKGKERKIKKRKGQKFIAPTKNDVIKYFKEKGYTEESAKKAFEYYNIAGWKDSSGKSVINWKQKMIAVWFKEEAKDETSKEIQKSYDEYQDQKEGKIKERSLFPDMTKEEEEENKEKIRGLIDGIGKNKKNV